MSLKRAFLFFPMTFLLQTGVYADSNPRLEIVLPSGRAEFTLNELKAKLPLVTISIDDPVYKKKKSYDGFDLDGILKLAGANSQSADEIVFQTMDGYAPTLPIRDQKQHESVLVFQEHGTAEPWEKFQQGKTWMTPAPFYLIWKEGKKLDEHFPWPYQLAKIELIDFSKKFSKLLPVGARPESSQMKGFMTFKALCMRCHSINLQGGEVGPELNIPKNVTEYWNKDLLRSFIRNAESFRLKSKMPSFQDLPDEKLNQVVSYLRYMKDHKSFPGTH